ncbi:MAG: FAD-dependent oxidoreductase, partial [Alphaproteobacteria bacterium]|nr:FAD-dependent oxidoreductase [Alphaproteobacteria bacterium]
MRCPVAGPGRNPLPDRMSARPRRFDRNRVVIGAGSAGLIAALTAARLQASVTLIEAGAMGGDCLNTGCVP